MKYGGKMQISSIITIGFLMEITERKFLKTPMQYEVITKLQNQLVLYMSLSKLPTFSIKLVFQILEKGEI